MPTNSSPSQMVSELTQLHSGTGTKLDRFLEDLLDIQKDAEQRDVDMNTAMMDAIKQKLSK